MRSPKPSSRTTSDAKLQGQARWPILPSFLKRYSRPFCLLSQADSVRSSHGAARHGRPLLGGCHVNTPEAVLALTVPDNAPTYVKAMWRYARGVAIVSHGGPDDAANEIAAIQAIEGEED